MQENLSQKSEEVVFQIFGWYLKNEFSVILYLGSVLTLDGQPSYRLPCAQQKLRAVYQSVHVDVNWQSLCSLKPSVPTDCKTMHTVYFSLPET